MIPSVNELSILLLISQRHSRSCDVFLFFYFIYSQEERWQIFQPSQASEWEMESKGQMMHSEIESVSCLSKTRPITWVSKRLKDLSFQRRFCRLSLLWETQNKKKMMKEGSQNSLSHESDSLGPKIYSLELNGISGSSFHLLLIVTKTSLLWVFQTQKCLERCWFEVCFCRESSLLISWHALGVPWWSESDHNQ